MKQTDCFSLLKENDRFLILTHARPDGDTLGSGAALCSALRRAGKTAFLFLNREVNSRYLTFVERYFAPDGFCPAFVVAVDIADRKLFPVGYEGPVDLCIDHHPSNTGYAAQTLLCPQRASCGEIVLQLIEQLHGSPDQSEANLLYIALSTDTGCFLHANTDADAHRAAARLLDAGAEAARLNQLLFRDSSLARLRLEGMIYEGLRSYADGTILVAVVTKQMLEHCQAQEEDCEDLAALPGRVHGGKLCITIREQPDGTSKVSVRSGPEHDACAICRRFGGGGHAMAAGCTIDCPPDEAVGRILNVVGEIYP